MAAPILTRILTAFQLTRVTLVFGAIGGIWFTILFTRSDDRYNYLPVYKDLSLTGALIAGVFVSMGLFAFATSLNDLLDLRHDTAFSPERPLPAGKIRSSQVIVIAIGSLLVAMAAAVPFGKGGLLLAVFTAAAILFYNAAGKHVPAVGLVLAGLIHAAQMMIANVELAFTFPVWLVFTHSMVIATFVYRFEQKRPPVVGRTLVAVWIGWLAWSVVILGLGASGGREAGFVPEHLGPNTFAFPIIAVIAFVIIAWRKTTRAEPSTAAEKLKRYGSIWQGVYAAAWLAGIGLWPQAIGMAAFALGGFVVMTILKEVNGLNSTPVSYRY
ncbi:MAG: UbiA family prenyltransferase [Phycisphaerales bacterium]|nr:UbiA family prenyltransferase [Phycisphaerales bacterium]